ncbi:MAG TPA: sugar ABC transporter permease YjfF [Phycisphaerae bacterium]|nr:sugar ABC transporter permease YjfF [Phycisphaerae bacterium]
MKNALGILRSPLLSTALVLLLLILFGWIKYPGFGSAFTFVTLIQDHSHLGIVAVGVTLVILSGGIDLSVGAAIGLGTVVMAVMMQHHYSVGVSIAATILLLTLGGALQGVIVHGFAVPPFLITLGGMFLYRGCALLITTDQIPVRNPGFDAISNISYRFLPWMHFKPTPSVTLQGILLVAVLIVAGVMLRWTRFGRNIYAVGGSESSALLMGLPVARTKVAVYAWSGLCAGIASLSALVGQPAGAALRAQGLELDAIAVAVIGGTLLTGGVGSATGTFMGLVIYGVIEKIVSFQGALPAWTRITVGALLLAFILLQQWLRRFAKRDAAA